MNIHIGNISDRTTEEKLITLFSTYGKVLSAKITLNHKDTNAKRYALVKMEEKQEALLAIEKLHKTYFMGKTVMVTEYDTDHSSNSDDAGTYNSQNGGYIRRF